MVTDPLDIRPPHIRRKSLRIGMMHYHLKPGGVTSVMRDMAIALSLRSGYTELEIDVLAHAGSVPGAREIFGDCEGSGHRRLQIVDIPSLAYREERYPDRDVRRGAAGDGNKRRRQRRRAAPFRSISTLGAGVHKTAYGVALLCRDKIDQKLSHRNETGH